MRYAVEVFPHVGFDKPRPGNSPPTGVFEDRETSFARTTCEGVIDMRPLKDGFNRCHQRVVVVTQKSETSKIAIHSRIFVFTHIKARNGRPGKSPNAHPEYE